ncbi:MAG: NAD(P)-dependent oxidoreductase [Deltaproteobacteria bacterium]|nr:NAD(P)-dependent oxidoreductase [Deltaproteobacteria bacterium]
MKILVTGGAGFIGVCIAKKLLERNHQVVVMSRSPKISDPEVANKVEIMSGDMRVFNDVMKAVVLSKPDTIIHMAYALTAAGEADPHWAVQVNVMGTNNFFEAARLNGVKRVIFCSSMAAYAPQEMYGERQVGEEDLLKSGSIYGQTKALNEFMAAKFEAKYGVEIPSVRISAVYGTGREARGVTAWTSQMVAAAVSGKPIKIALRSDQKANFIYVDDAAEQLVRLALAESLEHRIYNSGGVTSTPAQFATIVKKYYPDADIAFDEKAPIWPYPHLIDSTRLEKEIIFKVRDIEEGLLEQINQERSVRGAAPIEKLN